ncbi:hypothetical protein LI064_11610 [Clostridium perfringens]|uniref:hypothetical protein n=1 Tax=Clostridium perfringens TaxID=1502 RepID=UPI0022479E8F|nr:hypothetical protein [Clostridium perfringens]EGT0000985.1 hypothetical protein [Clostridium perfringens]MCX0355161.1 hypothetical protein [Clostridium perfringens]
MKKFMLKLSKIKFELRKFIIGCLIIGVFIIPFQILSGDTTFKFYVFWLILTALLISQHLYLYGTNTKWNESIKF